MSSQSTLLFLCDNPNLYANFIAGFQSAGFELLLASNVAQARSQLLRRRANAIIIRHDSAADDRALAAKLKTIEPRLSVYLVTDQQQRQRPPGIDAVMRGDLTDDVVARGMAVFFGYYLAPQSTKAALKALGSEPRSASRLHSPASS